MSRQSPWLLAAIAAIVFFINLGGAHLWDVDEAIFAQAAKEMLKRGDYVVPYFNGEVFHHKPALMYWLLIAGYQLFGTTEFAARFWPAVFGVGSVLLTWRLGRLMFSPTVGFWSGLILTGCIQFAVIARAATPDSFLVFFSTLAVLAFVSGTSTARIASGAANERNAPWSGQTAFEPRWRSWALAYAAMGLGVLTKGPVGVVLPTAVIGLFLLIVRAEPVESVAGAGWRGAARNAFRWSASVFSPGHVARTVWSMRPLTAVAVVLAVAGPWYLLVGLRTQGQWPAAFFGVHNFGRFLNAMENHRGPIFYYVVAIAIGLFPWSVFLAPAWSNMKGQLAARHPWRPGYILVWCWLAVWIGFFSLAGTKLPSYVAPAYPALALFIGCFVDTWLRESGALSRVWARMAWGTVALAGVGMLVGLPIVAYVFLGGDWLLGAAGLIPLAAAGVGLRFSERGQPVRAAWTMAALGVVLAVTLFGYGAARVDRHQMTPPLVDAIASHTRSGQSPSIVSFHFFRPSFVFYADRPIDQLRTADEVRSFFAEHPGDAFLITTDERLKRLEGKLPPDVAVVDSRPRFLQRGTVVLLGRDTRSAETPRVSRPAGPPRRTR
jgi:4-amino-4-deoxy-L-arabinose transferase-like glycosyltransferase